MVGQPGRSRLVSRGRRVLELQIRVALNKLDQFRERVRRQSIICIIRHVSHVNIYRIVEDGLEQFTASNVPFEFAKATRIFVTVDGVRVEAAGLAR